MFENGSPCVEIDLRFTSSGDALKKSEIRFLYNREKTISTRARRNTFGCGRAEIRREPTRESAAK